MSTAGATLASIIRLHPFVKLCLRPRRRRGSPNLRSKRTLFPSHRGDFRFGVIVIHTSETEARFNESRDSVIDSFRPANFMRVGKSAVNAKVRPRLTSPDPLTLALSVRFAELFAALAR